jgi:hypothetical protein
VQREAASVHAGQVVQKDRERAKAIRNRLAYRFFLETIPFEVRRAISAFPERHWHLLSFLARCGPYGMDFLTSNPTLGFCVASLWVFHKPPVQRPLRAARALLRRKRTYILDCLGFHEAHESEARVLAKIVPHSVTVSRILFMRDALNRDPAVLNRLAHLKRINAGVLRLATDAVLAPLCAHSLLEEVSMPDEDRCPRTAYSLRDCINIANQIQYPLERLHCYSRTQLARRHNELVRAFAILQGARIAEANPQLPPAPFAGTADGQISPVQTGRALVDESHNMDHCVSSYLPQIMDGRLSIYHVEIPGERATLSLVWNGSAWYAGELRGFRNADVSIRVRTKVDAWISGLVLSGSPLLSYHAALEQDIPF